MGRSDGRQRGLSVAAYGEIPMAAVRLVTASGPRREHPVSGCGVLGPRRSAARGREEEVRGGVACYTPSVEVRASDAERERAVERLQAAAVEGRLTSRSSPTAVRPRIGR